MNYWRIAFNKYAIFNGRARRKEFWIFYLINETIIFALGFVFPVLAGLFALVIIIPHVATGVRRMHDVNKSGWYFLFPVYNFILACMDGTTGDNKYGDDPKTDARKREQYQSKDGAMATKEFLNKHLNK